jgi:hypothetical protein
MVRFDTPQLQLFFDWTYRTSLAYGHPYMIDVQDCDTRLPSSGDLNDRYMDELVRISVILGRVLKSIYRYVSPRTSFYNPNLHVLIAPLDWLPQMIKNSMRFSPIWRTGRRAFRTISSSKVLRLPAMLVCTHPYCG